MKGNEITKVSKRLFTHKCALNVAAGALFAAALTNCSGTGVNSPVAGAPIPAGNLQQLVRPGERYNVLFSFGSNVNGYYGAYPGSGLIDVNGTLYGTTEYGGSFGKSDYVGYGTIYSISPGGVENVLYSFSGGSDGGVPIGSLVELNGKLYGTASAGGAHNNGTVFVVKLDGSDFRVLHAFHGGAKDGAHPMAGLVTFRARLYGTTVGGGSYGGTTYDGGTVFSVDPRDGSERIAHSFGGYGDGKYPLAPLYAYHGFLYGTTETGGKGGGVVFRIAANGDETVLHSFGGSDGAYPQASVAIKKGQIYGTTNGGGTADWGAVFGMNVDGGNEHVLHSFANNGIDGTEPDAGLIIAQGKLYGTTSGGGAHNCGTIFTLDKKSARERVLHSFCQNYNDGREPLAPLVKVNETLYGTTYEGGVRLPSCPHSADICDYGTVFSLSI